jgi:hypothetical protein
VSLLGNVYLPPDEKMINAYCKVSGKRENTEKTNSDPDQIQPLPFGCAFS